MKRQLTGWFMTHDTTMILALMLWVCVTPLMLLLTVPFFGWQTGLFALAVTLLAALLLYWRICLYPSQLLGHPPD